MNKLQQISLKVLSLSLLMATAVGSAQSQQKTYSETFNVTDETVLNINTSHADIEFDTWNKKQVLVEAVIELEDASEEDAQKYFENNGIKIMGNSNEIEVSTRNAGGWSSAHISGVPGLSDDLVIEIPEVPEVEPFFLDIQIPDLPDIPALAALPPMPPMPPMEFAEFDYEEYQERGEAYLEEWSESFHENFDEEWAQQIEEWGEQVEENMSEYRELEEEQRQEREAQREEMEEQREEMRKEAEEMRQQVREEHEKAREEHRKAAEEARKIHRNMVISTDHEYAPKVYVHGSDGKSRKYKVKRRIKIKMPKSVKVKMNVRHGEVKLADNTRDLNARLSYASLVASTIEGDETNIVASYSPVSVETWNLGKLFTSYSESIDLKDVKQLDLESTSSEVTIERLLKSAKVVNNLGALYIQSVAPEFTDMDINVQNGELVCVLPSSPYTIYARGTHSSFTYPGDLTLDKSDSNYQTVHEGYHLNENANKSIVINSQYSDIQLKK